MAKGNEMVVLLRAENEELKAKLEESKRKIDELGKKAPGIDALGDGFRRLLGIVGGYISIQAARQMAQFAGEVDSVTRAFEGLSAGVEGGSEALLANISAAAAGTMSQLEIMRSSNLALQLMGEEVSTRLPEMARIARATALATGRNVAEAYNDIIVAAGRQSVMVLDNLGISSTTARQEIDRYARSLNTTADKLTEAQKKQAFFNAILVAGNELVSRTNISTLSFGEQLQVAGAQIENIGIVVARTLTPAMESLMDSFDMSDTGFLDNIKLVAREIATLIVYLKMAARASMQASDAFLTFSTLGLNRLVRNRGDIHDTLEEMTNENENYMQGMQRDIERINRIWDNNNRRQDEQTRRRRRLLETPDTGSGGPQRKIDMSLSRYYEYTEQQRGQELAAEQEKYDALVKMFIDNEEMQIALKKAYVKRSEEIERKHDVFRKTLTDEWVSGINSAFSTFESKTKDTLKDVMFGKGGWKEWRKAMSEMLRQLVVDLTWAIAKAMLLKAVSGSITGSTGGGGGGLIQAVVGNMFKRGFMPSYQSGRIPVLAGGIPSDHFPAFIGSREAVINAESTRANYQLLKAMNANPGQQVGGGVTQNINITGNVLSDEFVDRRIVPKLKDIARRQGTELYRKQGI